MSDLLVAARRRMAAALSLVACLLASTVPAARAANTFDASWTAYPLPTVAGTIQALAWHDGVLFAAGGGVVFGKTTGRTVATWDGVQWQSANAGLSANNILAFAHRGAQLVAGGSGSTVSTSATEKQAVFAWNGASWDCIGGTNGTVYALAEFGGDLYAGGAFTTVDGVAAQRIARWDGAAWHAVGTGLAGSNDVRSLTVHAGKLVAGGSLAAYQGVAQWDGVSWTQVGAGLQSGANAALVNAVSSNGTTLFASGNCTLSGGVAITRTAAWNGTVWTSLPGATTASDAIGIYGGQPVAMALDGAVSRPQIWDGGAWQPFNHPTASPAAYAVDGSVLHAGGTPSSPSASPIALNSLWRFDGSAWNVVQQAWEPGMKGIQNLAYCAQEYHGELFVGGVFGLVGTGANLLSSPGAAKWTGTDWAAIGSGNQHFDLEVWNDSLVCAADGYVKVWNGSTWRKLTTTSFGGFTAALAVHAGELYALDEWTYGATALNGIARWTGSTWAPVGDGFDDGNGSAIAGVSWNGSLVVGGLFTDASGVSARNIARWDGAAYHALAGGVNSWVSALLPDGADLIVGGSFTEVDGSAIRGVARWDGTQWHAMGTRAVSIEALRAHGGRVYACGKFENEAAQTVDALARWNGEEWQLLVSGIGGDSFDFDFLGDDLYLVGSFSSVAGVPTRNFAKLANASTLAVESGGPRAGLALAVSPWPNPSRGRVELSVSLPVSGRARVSVHDVAGREVARLLDGEHGAGAFTLAWDGRVSPGLYFATIEAAGQRVTSRIVRLK